MKITLLFCYSYVVGAALPMIFAPMFPAGQVHALGISLIHWFFIFGIVTGAGSVFLYKTIVKKTSIYDSSSAYKNNKIFFYILTILCPIFIASANYYRVVDYSSPNHILNFIDESISERTLVRGTIIRDPDDRGTYSFIDIQPQEIHKFSKNEFEVDLSQPHVEFRTKIDRVVDGDTVEMFEAPPVWLVPGTKAGRSVRLLGINAPEIPHPQHNPRESDILPEPGGLQAKQYLKKLLEGKSVVVYIANNETQDQYGRWLGLIYIQGSKISVNEMILKKKLARIAFLPTEGLVHLKSKPPIKLTGQTGFVRAKIYPDVGDDLYFSLAYGQKIEVQSPLLIPRTQTNPSGFDYGRFLNARNIYAMTLPVKKSANIKILGEEALNPLIDVSLKLKKRMTAAIRETMPYPESAFLGGVTLGLRGGVPDKVKKNFQSTGVAHVLAVSGLHVGFVAVLLVMVSRLFLLPKKLEFFYILFGLIVFAIITGYSPATLRSVLMFTIGNFFHTFSGMGIRSSTKMTIPVSAFILLFFDPLKLPDGSFVLSYMAVWSLAHISTPVESVFRATRWTRSLIYFPFFFTLTMLTLISFVGISGQLDSLKRILPFFKNAPLMPEFLPEWKSLIVGVWLSGILLYWFVQWARKQDIVESIYRKRSGIVYGLLIFTCAQMAIQIGMAWPLSAVYFQRFSISGMFANFLAIPLIGFIVEYGLIASALLTATRFYLGSSIEFFLASLLNLVKTPMGAFILLAILAMPLYPLAAAIVNIIRYRNAPFFDSTEELKKCIPSLALIAIIILFSILEAYFGAVGRISLAVQGFNWALCQIFLGMAKNWGDYIPYPFVKGFTSTHLVMYYAGVMIFVFHKAIFIKLKLMYYRLRSFLESNPIFKIILVVGLLSIIVIGWLSYSKQSSRKLLMIFFDCGQGNAILIRTPNQKAILIDGGWGAISTAENDEDSQSFLTVLKQSETTGKSSDDKPIVSGWDFGESGIATTLSKYEISAIDLIINTSPRPGNVSAIPFLLNNFSVKEVVIPFSQEVILSTVPKMINYEKFLFASGLTEVAYLDKSGGEKVLNPPDDQDPYLKYAQQIYEKIIAKDHLTVKTAREGDIIYQESYSEKNLVITVLRPKGESKAGMKYYLKGDDPLGSRTIILKLTYGDFSCLMPTQISLKTINGLTSKDQDKLRADVLLLPQQGHPFWNPEEFLKSVKPKIGIIQYGHLPRAQAQLASMRMKDWYLLTTEKRLSENNISCYRTDQLGAIILQSDGSSLDEKKEISWILKDKKIHKAQGQIEDESKNKLDVGL